MWSETCTPYRYSSWYRRQPSGAEFWDEQFIFNFRLVFIQIYWLHIMCIAFNYIIFFRLSHKSPPTASSRVFQRRTTFWLTLSQFCSMLLIASRAPRIICTVPDNLPFPQGSHRWTLRWPQRKKYRRRFGMQETFPTTCSSAQIAPIYPYKPWKFVMTIINPVYEASVEGNLCMIS